MTMLEKEFYHNNNEWIYKTLKENGNCYVNKMIDLKEIAERYGLRIIEVGLD